MVELKTLTIDNKIKEKERDAITQIKQLIKSYNKLKNA